MANPTGAKDTFIPNPKSKLFERVREVLCWKANLRRRHRPIQAPGRIGGRPVGEL